MNKSTKFSPEVRERAVRLVQEHRGEYPSLWAAVEAIARLARTLSVSVVVSKLCEQKRTALNLVDHSVLVIDTPRPITRKSVLERLRFPNPRKWFTLYFSNQLVDPLNHLLVLLLPVKVIFPRLVSKD